eukprot:1051943-Prymnesium_polylepis.1
MLKPKAPEKLMKKVRTMKFAALLLLPATSAALAPPAPVVVFGQGSLEMRLITAKLAARTGFKTSI